MTSRRRLGRLVIPAILAAAGLWNAWRFGGHAPGRDFYQFWAGAQVARTAGSALYSSETRKAAAEEFRRRARRTERSDRMLVASHTRPEFEFFSTPFLYASFGVFGGRTYDRDLVIYRVLSLAATTVAVILIARAVGVSLASTFVLLAFLMTLFVPLRSDIRAANVNQLQLLMLAGVIVLFSRHRFLAGLLLGLAIAFKPNVVFIVPLLALSMIRDQERRLKPVLHSSLVGGVVTGVLGAVAIGSLYFRSLSAWVDWSRAARGLSQMNFQRGEGNLALGAGWILAGAAFAIIAAALFWRPPIRDPHPALLAGLGISVYLLSAPLVWPHYLVLAIPLAIALLGEDGSVAQCVVALVALTLIAVDPWVFLMRAGTAYLEGAVIWTGMIVVFGLGVWRLRAAEHHDARA